MLNRRSFVLTSLAAATLSVAMLAGCGGAPASSDDTEAGTGAVDTGTLIVGFDSSYPPYGYVGDDGEYTGFDLELAQEVAARNDWEVQLEPIDWDAGRLHLLQPLHAQRPGHRRARRLRHREL